MSVKNGLNRHIPLSQGKKYVSLKSSRITMCFFCHENACLVVVGGGEGERYTFWEQYSISTRRNVPRKRVLFQEEAVQLHISE